MASCPSQKKMQFLASQLTNELKFLPTTQCQLVPYFSSNFSLMCFDIRYSTFRVSTAYFACIGQMGTSFMASAIMSELSGMSITFSFFITSVILVTYDYTAFKFDLRLRWARQGMWIERNIENRVRWDKSGGVELLAGLIIQIRMQGRDERKPLSSSFSKMPDIPQIAKVNSFSADKLSSSKDAERVEQRNIVLKVIQKLNSYSEVEWKLLSFEQKRTIPGFKGRLEWNNPSKSLKIILKASFSASYFRLINTLAEGDLYIELEELNFEMEVPEKKHLQERIEGILAAVVELIRRKNFKEEPKFQSECLRCLLSDVSVEFLKRNFEERKKMAANRVDKKANCKNYMPYPAPACFSWNPLGSICITENKYPINKKAFIGDANHLRRHFQAGKNQNYVLRNDEGEVEISREGQPQSIYDWKIDDEVELIIFNRDKNVKKEESYYNSRMRSALTQEAKRQEPKKDEDSHVLGYLNRIQSAKLRKIYERYYGGIERASQFHRHDKMRVYDIRSLNRDYQDEIIYLLERIGSAQKSNILQTVFQNELSSYAALLTGPIDRFRYELISTQIRAGINKPQLSFTLFLKLFILENEFLGHELERYFKTLYRILGRKAHHELYFLGSYNHFDHIKSEMLFMDLLSRFLQNDLIDVDIRWQIQTKTKLRMPKLNFEGVVSESQKNNYLMNLFPLLIVKDREMEKFEFKQIKRVISANSKIWQFIRKLNDIVAKYEEGRIVYLRQVVAEYQRYREDDHSDDVYGLQPRRYFLWHCPACQKIAKLYELPSKQQLQICQKCKINTKSLFGDSL